MFSIVFMLIAAAAHPGQIMAGTAFERFADGTDRYCPSRQLRTITPGDLSWLQETFEDHLTAAQSARLARGDQQEAACVGRGGLACPTNRKLDALWRTKMLPAFSRFACSHPAPKATRRENAVVPPAAIGATAILTHLDLDSFPNSTGPRRQISLHTPADYGFTKLEGFPDGWAQISEPEDAWHLSTLLLAGGKTEATVCFVDAGGKGATYRATQVLHVTLDGLGHWTAAHVGDRPDCRNNPPFVEPPKPD